MSFINSLLTKARAWNKQLAEFLRHFVASRRRTALLMLVLLLLSYLAIYGAFFFSIPLWPASASPQPAQHQEAAQPANQAAPPETVFFSPDSADHYGSAVAGLVGTFFAVMGLVFVYHAYRAQQSQEEQQLFNKLYDDLLTDIDSIHYRSTGSNKYINAKEQLQGIEAIFHYSPDDGQNPNSLLNHLILILLSFEALIAQLDSPHRSQDHVALLKTKVYFLFYSKIFWPVMQGFYEKHRNEIISKGWGNSKILFFKYEKFSKATIRHLSDAQLLENSYAPRKDETELTGTDAIIYDIVNRDYTTWKERFPEGDDHNTERGFAEYKVEIARTPPNKFGSIVISSLFPVVGEKTLRGLKKHFPFLDDFWNKASNQRARD